MTIKGRSRNAHKSDQWFGEDLKFAHTRKASAIALQEAHLEIITTTIDADAAAKRECDDEVLDFDFSGEEAWCTSTSVDTIGSFDHEDDFLDDDDALDREPTIAYMDQATFEAHMDGGWYTGGWHVVRPTGKSWR